MPNITDKLQPLTDLAEFMRVGLFASRPTAEEALEYAYQLIGTLPAQHRAAAYTALHVMLNTVCDAISAAVTQADE